MKSRCPERRETRRREISGAHREPATLYSGLHSTRPYWYTSALEPKPTPIFQHRRQGISQKLWSRIVTRTSKPALTSCRNPKYMGSGPLSLSLFSPHDPASSDARPLWWPEVFNRKFAVKILALLWTRRWFTRRNFLLFLTDTFASHPIGLSKPDRQDLSGSLCIATLWPRQTSARRDLAAPSSPQGRTTVIMPSTMQHEHKALKTIGLDLHPVSRILLSWSNCSETNNFANPDSPP